MSTSLASLIAEQANQVCEASRSLISEMDSITSTPEREVVLREVLKSLMEIKDRILLEIRKLQPAESAIQE